MSGPVEIIHKSYRYEVMPGKYLEATGEVKEWLDVIYKDAERYRFLRNSHGYIRSLPSVHMMEPEKLDAACDEGIATLASQKSAT